MSSYGDGGYGDGFFGGASFEPPPPVFVQPSAAFPALMLEWAPLSSPFEPFPFWVDITPRLRGFEWSYGRNDETTNFEPGTGHIILDNRDRAFDPTFEAGPWFGNIKPRRLFRLRAEWNEVVYPVFLAHARGFPQAYPGGVDNMVRVELADDLAILQAVDLDAIGFDRPPERSDERIEALLEAAGIPEDRINLDSGNVTVTATTPSTTTTTTTTAEPKTALDHLRDVVVTSEGWALYVGKDGFHSYA